MECHRGEGQNSKKLEEDSAQNPSLQSYITLEEQMSNTAPFPFLLCFPPLDGKKGGKRTFSFPLLRAHQSLSRTPTLPSPSPLALFPPCRHIQHCSTRRRSNEEEGWKKSELESQRRREIKEAEVASQSHFHEEKRGGRIPI